MNPYSPPAAAPYVPGGYPAPYREPIPSAPTELVLAHLKQTRPWVILMSVLCFLGAIFMCLGGLGMMAMGALSSAATKGAIPVWLGLLYVPFGVFYVYPGLKLWAYGAAIGRLLRTHSLADLEEALGHQKSFWKFCGIAVIAMLVLYFIVLIVAVGFGLVTGLTHRH